MPVKAETETGLRQPQATERGGHQELDKAGRILPQTLQSQRGPAEMECWPPELCGSKGLCPS